MLNLLFWSSTVSLVIGQLLTLTSDSSHFSLLCFVFGGVRFCLTVSSGPMFLWIPLNFCPMNLLLVRSHQAEINHRIASIQRRNDMARVGVEPRSGVQSRRKNDTFTLGRCLPTYLRMKFRSSDCY